VDSEPPADEPVVGRFHGGALPGEECVDLALRESYLVGQFSDGDGSSGRPVHELAEEVGVGDLASGRCHEVPPLGASTIVDSST
jgi:hypothetical protein